ncbi:unnamed protein product [Lathyrus oleraceus]
MKTNPFISVVFLCALIFISTVAIELSKDEKLTGAFEKSKTKLGVNNERGLGGEERSEDIGKGYSDGDYEFSIESGGWKGSINNGGHQGGGKNNGLGGQGGMGNEVGWRGGENNEFGGQGRRNEVGEGGEIEILEEKK